MWNCLTQWLKYFDLSVLIGSCQVVAAAATILDSITRKENYQFYKKSGVFHCTNIRDHNIIIIICMI